MNTSPSWWQAITTVPRLDAAQWAALSSPVRWLLAVRSSVLFMTLMSSAFGGLLAWRDGVFAPLLWLLCLLGLLLAHATNNLLNDLTDSRRGVDKGNYFRNQYGVHPLEDGLLSPKSFYVYIALTAAAALLVGAAIVVMRGGLTLPLMLAGSFFVLFYTWPLKHYGLGEPAVLLVWGPLMVGGTYYVCSGAWSNEAALLGLLYGIGPTTVLFGKHIDKLELDRAKGVHTLPVILGESLSRRCTQGLLLGQYVICAALIASGSEHWLLGAVFLAIPKLMPTLKQLQRPKPSAKPERYPEKIWPLWFSAGAFAHTRYFTSLFVIALFLAVWVA